MPVLYLTEQGASLRKQGETFVVAKDGETLQKIPAIKVEQVVVFGAISLTTPVINYLLREGKDCVFCSSEGQYHGRLISNESNFGLLRLKQMQMVASSQGRLHTAREMVKGKLANQRTMLLRYHRSRGAPDLSHRADLLQKYLGAAEEARDIGTLLGIEGSASAAYYAAFKSLIQQEMGFQSRVRRPPSDPVNSMLSFGYTLLAYDVQSAIRTVGMEPFLGFLHAVEYSRPSLALDIMEEFRPIIVDSLVLRSINTRAITREHFRQGESPRRPVLLTQEGMKRFIHAYEERVETRVIHPVTGHQVTYRRCLELQVRLLARVVRGEAARYPPFLVK